jgi:hypothetical protein
MFHTRLHATITIGWFIALSAVFSMRIAFGVPTSFRDGLVWLLLGGIPAVVLAPLFRGAPTTVAEVLYDTEQVAPPVMHVGHDIHVPRG